MSIKGYELNALIVVDQVFALTRNKKRNARIALEGTLVLSTFSNHHYSAVCIHRKHRDYCKECGGKQICPHNKHKGYCKICIASKLCQAHQKEKSQCTDCKTQQAPTLLAPKQYPICIHGKNGAMCLKCLCN